jgi:hypothetical protein
MSRSTAIPALPAHERPRERLVALGAKALTDAELVAIQLGTGGPGENAIALAQALLAEWGGVAALGGGQAQLDGRREVVEHAPPRRVLRGTAAVALVDDHEVEEVLRVVLEEGVDVTRSGHCLIAREVDLAAPVDSALDSVHRFVTERRPEVLAHRLGEQRVQIGEVEDAECPIGFGDGVVGAELGHDLHCREGLAGTRRHEQQDTATPRGDRPEHPVYDYRLVPAGLDDVAGRSANLTWQAPEARCRDTYPVRT